MSDNDFTGFLFPIQTDYNTDEKKVAAAEQEIKTAEAEARRCKEN